MQLCAQICRILIFKGLNSRFKIAATTKYITRIKDSTKNHMVMLDIERRASQFLNLKGIKMNISPPFSNMARDV